MNINKLAWTELVAALGVISSLIFVGYEVRQSNSLGRLQAQQSMADAWSTVNLTLASNHELAALLARMHGGELKADFAPGEAHSLYLVLHGLDHTWEMYYTQTQIGVLEEGDISFPPPNNRTFSAAFHRELWPEIRGGFNEEFAVFWEQRFKLTM
ncbi:MAG: hypothetical protein OEQ90_05585 [Gammaproteobacteria bacterium]|nr:hypothetical protein [Gammaproteobacteria bacterium]